MNQMNNVDMIDESVDALTRTVVTRLRDRLIVLLCLEFENRRVTQRDMAHLFDISQSYISRLVTQAKERAEAEVDAEERTESL